jgi:hypothetical protein
MTTAKRQCGFGVTEMGKLAAWWPFRIFIYSLGLLAGTWRTLYLYNVEHRDSAFVFAIIFVSLIVISIGRDLNHWRKGEPL